MNEQQRKAMELALESLENAQANVGEWWPEAITALKEALAQDALQALHDENKSLGLYEKGYADAMNWKVQNHLEHLPTAQPEQDLSEQGRNRSAVLGNNIEAMMDAGLPFLKALETTLKVYDHDVPKLGCVNHDCDKCKAQPEHEPVVCTDEMCACRGGPCVSCLNGECEKAQREQEPLYTTPPQRKPLTDEQIEAQKADWFHADLNLKPETIFRRGIRAAEAAHGIKENT